MINKSQKEQYMAGDVKTQYQQLMQLISIN